MRKHWRKISEHYNQQFQSCALFPASPGHGNIKKDGNRDGGSFSWRQKRKHVDYGPSFPEQEGYYFVPDFAPLLNLPYFGAALQFFYPTQRHISCIHSDILLIHSDTSVDTF